MDPVRALALAAATASALAACATVPRNTVSSERPRDTLPGDASLATVRSDLVSTAADRFGQAAVRAAFSAPTYLIVKRFTGFAPPPPPGAGPDWAPPTPSALLLKDARGWSVATAGGWRPADPAAAAEIDRVIADPAFWSEPRTNMPCPDYGASLLLLKAPARPETVRSGQCPNRAEAAVIAALRA